MKSESGGTYIKLDFGTTAPATTMVLVSDKPMFAEETATGWATSSEPQKFGLTGEGNKHITVIKDLKPSTVYWIVILLNPAPDYDWLGSTAWDGIAYTKMKVVSVGITWGLMIDDSDELSAGELDFIMQLGDPNADFTQPGNSWKHARYPQTGSVQIDSGNFFSPLFGRLSKAGVGNSVKFAISCFDDDELELPTLFSTCGEGDIYDEYLGTGSNDCGEWNSGSWIFDISGGTDMSSGLTLAEQEEFSFNFVRPVLESQHSCLEYVVFGTVYVTYKHPAWSFP